MSKLDYALQYAKFGWHVFPCHYILEGQCSCGKNCKKTNRGKHPATYAGFKNATCDPEQIKRWWSQADYNIGVPTGAAKSVPLCGRTLFP